MITTAAGQEAESLVAKHLSQKGWKILDKNWRRRSCEIDIIAEKDKILYFIEVKFRRSNTQGDGLDYITPAKLKQMKFAATLWTVENGWHGDFRLMAAAVEPEAARMAVTQLIDVS